MIDHLKSFLFILNFSSEKYVIDIYKLYTINFYDNVLFIDITIIIIILSRLTLTNQVTVIYLLHAGPCQCTGRRVYLRCLIQALGN